MASTTGGSVWMSDSAPAFKLPLPQNPKRLPIGGGFLVLVFAALALLVVLAAVAVFGRKKGDAFAEVSELSLSSMTFPVVTSQGELVVAIGGGTIVFPTTATLHISGGRAELVGPTGVIHTSATLVKGTLRIPSFAELQVLFQDDAVTLRGKAQIHPFPELNAAFTNDRSGLVLDGRIQLPPFAAPVWNTRLDDVYDPIGIYKTRWAWLREAIVTIPRFVVEFSANGAKPIAPESKATIGGWIESQLCDGPSPLKRKTPSGKSDCERFRAPDNVTPQDFLSPTPSSMEYYRQRTKTE